MSGLLRGCVLLAALLGTPAHSQLPHPLVEGTPLERAKEAFDNDYGRHLVGTFARILRDSADPVCVGQRQILAHRWADEAQLILVRRGGQMLHMHARAQDYPRFDALLAAFAGPGAVAEVLRLREHPEVREMRALHRPAKLARLADYIVDMVDRYVLLNRFQLAGRVSPLSSGNEALLRAHPAERSEGAVDAYLSRTGSNVIARWMVLDEALGRAERESRRTEELLKLGPSQMMAGLDEDLAALCVGRRP